MFFALELLAVWAFLNARKSTRERYDRIQTGLKAERSLSAETRAPGANPGGCHGIDQLQTYENNDLQKREWSANGLVGDFVAAVSSRKPLGSITCFRNLLIIREELWVEYLVPNQIQQVIENYGIMWIPSDYC